MHVVHAGRDGQAQVVVAEVSLAQFEDGGWIWFDMTGETPVLRRGGWYAPEVAEQLSLPLFIPWNDIDGSGVVYGKRDRALMLKLLMRSLGRCAQVMCRYNALRRTYQRSMSMLTSRERWHEVFDQQRGGPREGLVWQQGGPQIRRTSGGLCLLAPLRPFANLADPSAAIAVDQTLSSVPGGHEPRLAAC